MKMYETDTTGIKYDFTNVFQILKKYDHNVESSNISDTRASFLLNGYDKIQIQVTPKYNGINDFAIGPSEYSFKINMGHTSLTTNNINDIKGFFETNEITDRI